MVSTPLKAGPASVGTKVMLSGSLPARLAKSEIKIAGTAPNGDSLLCMDIKTAPAAAEAVVEETVQGGNLKLSFTDCGAKHGKVTGLTPDTLTLGVNTAVTGSGSVDEDVTAGNYDITLTAGGGIVHKTFHGDICKPETFVLPLGAGSISWVGIKVILSGSLPARLAKSEIKIA